MGAWSLAHDLSAIQPEASLLTLAAPWSLHVQNRESNHNSEFLKPYRLFKAHSPLYIFLYLINLIFTLSLLMLSKIPQSNYRNIRVDSAYL